MSSPDTQDDSKELKFDKIAYELTLITLEFGYKISHPKSDAADMYISIMDYMKENSDVAWGNEYLLGLTKKTMENCELSFDSYNEVAVIYREIYHRIF